MMHYHSIGVAWPAALAIIVIGLMYLFRPLATAPSFGLPLPETATNVAW